jgi:tetratricopeptide (TPR) repeat protein
MISDLLTRAAGLMDAGRLDEAQKFCDQALAVRRGDPDAQHLLGLIAIRRGDFDAAIAFLGDAARKQPRNPDLLQNYAGALAEVGRLADAAEQYRLLLRLKPGFADAAASLGWLMIELEKPELALDHLRRVIAAEPHRLPVRLNMGRALQKAGMPREALREYEIVRTALPDDPVVLNNIAMVLQHLGRLDEADATFRRALTLAPQDAEARHSFGDLCLQRGRFEEGWRLWEDRIGARQGGVAPSYTDRRWDGQPVDRLLVWAEQGVGDQILYGSMLPDLPRAAREVTFQVESRLVALFQRSIPAIRVVPWAGPIDASLYDAQVPLGSLGQFLRRGIDDFPPQSGYLKPDPERTSQFRTRLAESGKISVGFAWRSNAQLGKWKSLRLEEFAGALGRADIQLVDLQYGDTQAERKKSAKSLKAPLVHLPDLDLKDDLDGVAALASACDLVITSSNAAAHIAGATGTPLWVLVPWATGRFWYWRFVGARNPWYPQARIFVQDPDQGWAPALASIGAALAEWLAERNRTGG